MHRGPIFKTFSEAAAGARRVAARASSDVLVSRVDAGWILEIEALKKLEQALLEAAASNDDHAEPAIREWALRDDDSLLDVDDVEIDGMSSTPD